MPVLVSAAQGLKPRHQEGASWMGWKGHGDQRESFLVLSLWGTLGSERVQSSFQKPQHT